MWVIFMKSKSGVLLLVQVDHLSSETVGASIELLYEAGASNVNVTSTITKKNRPGYIVLIDCQPEAIDVLEDTVTRELGVSGWHRIDTAHCYQNVQYIKKEIEIVYDEGRFCFEAEGKVINDDFFNIRPESKSCIALKETLKNVGIKLSLLEINRRLYQAFLTADLPTIYIKEGVTQ